MTSLQVRDLGVSFGARQILHNLDFAVDSGAFAAILGPSGCGKTTLLRTIAGLITPSSGAIRFGKQLVSVSSLVLPPHKRNIGYVPQEGGLFPHLTVGDNVGFSIAKSTAKTERAEIISEMLTLVGLKGFEKRFPHELSGGQQTRVALARALAMKPAMVLLDEPFASLDQALRAEISEEVSNLLKKTKTTTIMVTHDREDALVSADVIALMRSGTVVQMGTPSEVYIRPISADAAESTGDIVTIPALKRGDGSIASALHNNSQSDAYNGFILVRPEEIRINAAQSPDSVTATIARINYYGHDALIELNLPQLGELIRARVAAPMNFHVGQRVAVALDGPIRWMSEKATHE